MTSIKLAEELIATRAARRKARRQRTLSEVAAEIRRERIARRALMIENWFKGNR
ncbi:hypothetical protein [Leifsonia sp. Root4]|uniref:hypothetical protein n=1 Tax=Leifsonia sp. Root4 TaxID=1736525 RepID=UPI000A501DFB|nr:hypothetical protein [Leifsonia sp. Root4]